MLTTSIKVYLVLPDGAITFGFPPEGWGRVVCKLTQQLLWHSILGTRSNATYGGFPSWSMSRRIQNQWQRNRWPPGYQCWSLTPGADKSQERLPGSEWQRHSSPSGRTSISISTLSTIIVAINIYMHVFSINLHFQLVLFINLWRIIFYFIYILGYQL